MNILAYLIEHKDSNIGNFLRSTDLRNALGVVAQFEVQNGQILPVDFTENLKTSRGVRQNGAIIQFGLTHHEIKGVYDRMQKLLKRVDAGKVKIFEFS